jgi:hypothetical protein
VEDDNTKCFVHKNLGQSLWKQKNESPKKGDEQKTKKVSKTHKTFHSSEVVAIKTWPAKKLYSLVYAQFETGKLMSET